MVYTCSTYIRRFKVFALVTVLAGCAAEFSPEESFIKTGGMTSGGWGRSFSNIYATCSVTIKHASSPEDYRLSVAKIHEHGIGASLRYELLLGDQKQQLDSIQLHHGFHRHAEPLMIDGRSYPLARIIEGDLKAVGSLTLKPSNDHDFNGIASYKHEGQTSLTVVELACTRTH